MSHSSEFSATGKKSLKGAKAGEPAAETIAQTPETLIPADMLPPASDALKALFESPKPSEPVHRAAEIIDIEHMSLEELEAFFPSENPEPVAPPVTPAVAPPAVAASPAVEGPAKSAEPAAPVTPANERREKRRARISAPVRVRSTDITNHDLDDATTTMNVSRIGILLASKNPAYYRSMDVMVTFPYSKAPKSMQAEQPGRVVRISELPDGRRSIAIALGVKHREDAEFISASGEKLHAEPASAKITVERDPNSLRPLVLALDGEAAIRDSLKSYLAGEGYDVITVTNAQEARDVLSQCTPSLLIAEIEGEGMPGYDICAHCKSTPRLQRVPVMLTTSSAYPSDYASAHSLGAVVCMAKPYRQERLGHVVKLLAPPANAKETVEPPRPADPSRRHLGSNGTKSDKASGPSTGSTVNRRFRFGGKS
jgi:CheY-like chemotaxis protein